MYCFVDTGMINVQVYFSIKLNLLPLAKNDGPYRVTQLTLNDLKDYKNARNCNTTHSHVLRGFKLM